MKGLVMTVAAIALISVSLSGLGNATGPFDKKLSPDDQIVHALNRLTFGPRPGDAEEVRRIGVSKWIEMQLHPDQIGENPALEARLKPLETLRMDMAALIRDYAPQQNMGMFLPPLLQLNNLLSDEERRKVLNGTAEERTDLLKSLAPDKRQQVLATLPPNVTSHTPEFKKEIEESQTRRQEQQRMENRRLNPQLPDLLNPDQITAARSGNKDQLTALFSFLDADKRVRVEK
jgi:hypothetical protein